MPIDTTVPYSDGWWLAQCYEKLRVQQKHANEMYERYKGNPPLPTMNQAQAEAVKWFIGKARTNFERLCVQAVLNRTKIKGIRTAADSDEGGDSEGYKKWKKARGTTWSKEAHRLALAMGCSFVMVGKDDRDKLLVTAEDPRTTVTISDPSDPMRVVAGMKLMYDAVRQEDVVQLFVLSEDGQRMKRRTARRKRSMRLPMWKDGYGTIFNSAAFSWGIVGIISDGDELTVVEEEYPEWLQGTEDREAMVPIVPFENEDGQAEFEPHLELLDRITQQILQRMTIATLQAFKQRAVKGVPLKDPKTGDEIDYTKIFVADPAAVWIIPATAEVWESGEVNLQGILLSVRDDVKDFCAVSGTPLYTVSPDAAQGSAEGASLMRETLTFKVQSRREDWELPHSRVASLIFLTLGDEKRIDPEEIEMLWVAADLPSMTERANAIAQTRDVLPIFNQYTEIWGMSPEQAELAQEELKKQKADAQEMAQKAAIDAAKLTGEAPKGSGSPGPGGAIKQLKPETGVRKTPDATKVETVN